MPGSLGRLGIVAVLLLGACEAAHSPFAVPPPSLSVEPELVQVAAGSDPIGFRAVLAGVSGPVEWELAGAGTLDPTSGEAVLFTPPRASREPLSATLRARAGGLEATARISISPSAPIAVRARFLDAGGNPVPGVAALLTGWPLAESDESGEVAWDAVAVPYDFAYAAPGNTVHVFRNLTAGDLRVSLSGNASATANASIRGTLSAGAGFPQPKDHLASVVARPVPGGAACSARPDNKGAYRLDCKVHKNGVTSGTVHALQWEQDAQGPLRFTGYGKRSFEVAAGKTVTGQDLALAPLDSAAISISVRFPDGWTLTRKGLRVELEDGASFVEQAEQVSAEGWPPELAFLAPSIAGAQLVVELEARLDPALTESQATSAAAFRVPAGAPAREVALPRPLALLEPEDGASSVPLDSGFRWEAASGVKRLELTPATGGKKVVLHTDAAEADALPDLAALEVAAPPGTAYHWRLEWTALATIDQELDGSDAHRESFRAVSDVRSFTTPP